MSIDLAILNQIHRYRHWCVTADAQQILHQRSLPYSIEYDDVVGARLDRFAWMRSTVKYSEL